MSCFEGPCAPLGNGVPLHTPHTVSVSLPEWQDNVDYEEGRDRVKNAMRSGYPRFFIKPEIQELSDTVLQGYGIPEESCMLFSSKKNAEECRAFMLRRDNATSRHVSLTFRGGSASLGETELALEAVMFNSEYSGVAKQFWQHTGLGISSRYAERCLQFHQEQSQGSTQGASLVAANARFGNKAAEIASRLGGKNSNDCSVDSLAMAAVNANCAPPSVVKPKGKSSHYSSVNTHVSNQQISSSDDDESSEEEEIEQENADESVQRSSYLEQRFGRNLDAVLAKDAKLAMRRRIAHLYRELPIPEVYNKDTYKPIEADDIYLYPTGMSAIWSAHQTVLQSKDRPIGKSVCFGFPYTDTLKVLQKWGPGCHFLGFGTVNQLDELRNLAAESKAKGEPILSLVCELPSNPLLKSVPLEAIHEIALEYDFFVIVDDTVATFANVDVSQVADITVSSLTKAFSGDSNVMGGSLMLSKASRHYAQLKNILNETFQDTLFDEDAMFLERNSRNMLERVQSENDIAESICDYIHEYQKKSSALKALYYPKYVTPDLYNVYRRPVSGKFRSGYSALLSVEFYTRAQASAFFDALNCYKGPSLGTNFTLACPYTIIAHYLELDWVKSYGVDSNLVRISVGLEGVEILRPWLDKAFAAAEAATSA